MIPPLTDITYRRLFAAQVIALAGTGLSTVALALLAYDLAGGDAGVVLGTALSLKMVAYVGVAPLIGAVAHRARRKALLIGLDIARALMIMCLPFVTEIWQICLLIFALNACSAGFTPTFQASIPDILPDDAHYTRALSLSRLAYDLENLLSPLLAAAVLLVLSYDTLFALNAVTFLVSALLIASVSLPSPRPHEREAGGWSNITFGVRTYLATPRLRGLLALSVAVAAAGAMVIVNTVVYVRDRLEGSESDIALVLAAFGAGSMAAAIALPRFLDRHPERPFMLVGGVLCATGLFLGLAAPALTTLAAIWLLLGVGSSLIQTPGGRLLKRSAHEANRPSLFAAQFALSHACWLVGYALAGGTSSAGLMPVFTLLGSIAAISTLLAFRLWPATDPHELEHTAHPRAGASRACTYSRRASRARTPGMGRIRTTPPPHTHQPKTHRHPYVIDLHHPSWP
ncbi:MAG: MFS transporter [Pseudomonadales bacterium]|jgi:MFS family permease|nr:MFS transporter [Pseudomonadales bacterium]MDP6471555.1 MFS transporter [Pseudomonadales bacterium]MDP6828818.1 MFS transporter [Pseudomonadales bacterium]